MFPFWDARDRAGPRSGRGASASSRSARSGARTPSCILDRLGPDAELHVIDPVPDFDPPSTSGGSPAATSSTATSASTCSPTLPPMDAASSTATTTGTPSTTSSGCSREVGPRGRRAAAGADPARRGLALRPPRPLLRARHDPRGVPPAVRTSGACGRARAEAAASGGLNPTMYNAERRAGRATA